jgi:hypothetical protein
MVGGGIQREGHQKALGGGEDRRSTYVYRYNIKNLPIIVFERERGTLKEYNRRDEFPQNTRIAYKGFSQETPL